MGANSIETMQQIVDFFTEFEDFFESSKAKLSPILDEVWEHYEDNKHNLGKRAHALMSGMSLRHDHGKKFTLFDVANALQYAKLYMGVEGSDDAT